MHKDEILQAAEAWDRHALDLESSGRITAKANALRYRQVAKSLRLEAETGRHHCHCHLVPDDQCPKKKERGHD